MKTKKQFSILILLIAVITLSAFVSSDNGKAGSTGSPGESTCVSCHSTYALNAGNGFIDLDGNMANWEYVPGQTYNLHVKVGKSGFGMFGVGLEALDASGNNAGTLTITDPAHTQIKTKTINGVSRKNVVHTQNGGVASDSMLFNFNWTAPASPMPVTFYYSGNACNNDGNDNGDYVYAASRLVNPATSTQVDEPSGPNFKIYPTLCDQRMVQVELNNKVAVQTVIQLSGLRGETVKEIYNGGTDAGLQTLRLQIPPSITTGVYYLRIGQPGRQMTQKIVIAN